MIGGKWELGNRPLAAGSRLLADGRRLLSAGRSCFKYCFSYPYGDICGSSATDASEDHTLESIGYRCIYIIVIGVGPRTRKQLIGYAPAKALIARIYYR